MITGTSANKSSASPGDHNTTKPNHQDPHPDFYEVIQSCVATFIIIKHITTMVDHEDTQDTALGSKDMHIAHAQKKTVNI